MRRRLMQFLFALGLALTLAAGGVTLSAAWRPGYVEHEWTDWNARVTRYVAFHASTTRLGLSWGSYPAPPVALVLRLTADPVTPETFMVPAAPVPDPPPRWWERLGFGYAEFDPFVSETGSTTRLGVPSWFAIGAPAAVTVTTLVPLLRDRRRRERRRRGLCLTCAYDLRGAAHERCPECGAIVQSAVPAAV